MARDARRVFQRWWDSKGYNTNMMNENTLVLASLELATTGQRTMPQLMGPNPRRVCWYKQNPSARSEQPSSHQPSFS